MYVGMKYNLCSTVLIFSFIVKISTSSPVYTETVDMHLKIKVCVSTQFVYVISVIIEVILLVIWPR